MGAFDIIAKAAKGAKKAPFYSKIDEVLESMPRNKGTGAEFLREIEKTKGVKPAEIQDRGIVKALKDKPKMTKVEVQKVLEENPPPRVQEKVLSDAAHQEALEREAQSMFGESYDELLTREAREVNEAVDAAQSGAATQYADYKTPGGENYREILLKLPGFDSKKEKRLMELEADIRRTSDDNKAKPFLMEQAAALRAEKAKFGPDYRSGHFEGEPNILAHIRVQDFKTPEGKKVLLVDEIQSDWHQAGRDLRNKEIKRIMSETGVDKKTASTQVPDDFGYRTAEVVKRKEELTKMAAPYIDRGQAVPKEIYDELVSLPSNFAPPDAPFKKNWHELAMKRVMDYAAQNGYDTVAITPGVEQVKRYEDATRQAVDEVAMYGDTLVGFKGGRKVIEQPISSPDELEQYIGKDMAQKLASTPPDMNFIRSIKGEDITVGGEGMKGFYDEKLVNYLNDFGKPYGASVRREPFRYAPSPERVAQGEEADALLGQLGVDIPTVAPTQYHMFDITPQLREEVKTKGLPLYSKTGMGPEGLAAGTGAATIGSEVFDTNNEQQVQNPVHFTENPDAMLLELMQRN